MNCWEPNSRMSKSTFGVLGSVLLISFASVVGACASPSSSIYSAISQDGGAAHQTGAEHEATQQILQGLLNSACNIEQYQYIALEAAYNNALYLDSMCASEFYVGATTMADVGQWLACESMALPLVLAAYYAMMNFGHFDALSQKCSFCADAPSPPVAIPVQFTNPQHVRGIQTIVATLDWSHKLMNIQGVSLEKGIASLVVDTLIDQVHSGLLVAAHDATGALVETAITKGYTTSTLPGSKMRRDATANATDEAYQLMNSSIEITATFQIIALEPNFTYAQVQNDINLALKSDNFTSLLGDMNANITSQSFKTFVPADAEATATSSGSAGGPGSSATGSAAASATGENGAKGRSVGSEMGLGVIVGVVMAMVMIP